MTHVSLVFVGVVTAIVLVAGATVAYFPLANVTSTASTTRSTTSNQQGNAETGSKDALVLGAGANASVVSSGQALSIRIWERNTLDSENNVSSAKEWLVEGLSLGPCENFNMPFGIKIMAGYYTESSANLSSASSIQYFQPGFYACPALFNVGWYLFSPLSTNATLGGFCTPEPCGISWAMNGTVTISGEYVGGSTTRTPLTPGLYTIVVGDEWGAYVFLYFSVTSAGQNGTVLIPTGTSVTVSSSEDCVAGNFHLAFATRSSSVLTGGFAAGGQGVTLYVATSQQASNLFEGHPSQWVSSTGLEKSATFSVPLSQGDYVVWIEGADLNCGAQIVIPLEILTQVNVTQSFVLTPT
jgi:hypothetical protein